MYVRSGFGVGLNGECCERPDRERVAKVFDEHQASYEKAQPIGDRCHK